jgi:Fic family protein
MPPSSSSRKSSFSEDEAADLLVKDESARALLEAKNGLEQFDEVLRLAREAIPAKIINLTPELIGRLNSFAIRNIRRSAGQVRREPISITNTPHQPPPPESIEKHLCEMCSYVNQNWNRMTNDLKDAIHLSAYLMWRLNWIHPFRDGNGRTSRAVSYLVLSVRLGQLLPGVPTIADQIVDNKQPYYAALDAADAAWKSGQVDVTVMESLLRRLLERQLNTV